MTEAGTTGIFFMKMPQSPHPLGAAPGAVFHNQVNHKQPPQSPSSRTSAPPTHTPGKAASAEVCSAVAAALRQAEVDGTQVSLPNLTEQVHHEAEHSNSTFSSTVNL